MILTMRPMHLVDTQKNSSSLFFSKPGTGFMWFRSFWRSLWPWGGHWKNVCLGLFLGLKRHFFCIVEALADVDPPKKELVPIFGIFSCRWSPNIVSRVSMGHGSSHFQIGKTRRNWVQLVAKKEHDPLGINPKCWFVFSRQNYKASGRSCVEEIGTIAVKEFSL